MDINSNSVRVIATFNPDSWCTSITVEGIGADQIPDTVNILVKRRPRPRPDDPAETRVLTLKDPATTTSPLRTGGYVYQ